ncbi:hypothetical protein HanRHA438_Chr01g0019881 [Helianthus annuus]|uniref:Uncharacterized protein n=1 Tax=Helianthus annuus TaxID=4232 RepID=A0A251VQ76_HELAN|nr:hypothetical protein HanXRQr2_Chr01g0019371 [Helianthus annuus]KAJ0611435.1 hypothetical protein HanHA300_Chr01g0015771 [Helianthus annuus]KAJ0622481.1 hypothetical protein HanIR_Chr01g0021181 [Helianthus annuus]KAJ0626731.1 hypothetical protein HanHA89_Chr01g0017361 [Helianthus annuus]KAJ0783080.1 hypothetical protein HanLR1_Chr01g0016311 [Helianthus annuus]
MWQSFLVSLGGKLAFASTFTIFTQNRRDPNAFGRPNDPYGSFISLFTLLLSPPTIDATSLPTSSPISNPKLSIFFLILNPKLSFWPFHFVSQRRYQLFIPANPNRINNYQA